MSDVEARIEAGDLGFLPEEALGEFVVAQRWFGAKAREVVGVHVLESASVRTAPPLLAVAFVEMRFQPGTHDIYQVPVGFRPAGEGWGEAVLAEADGWTAYDALADPALARELVELMRRSATIEGEEATLAFRSLEELAVYAGELGDVRGIGAEQSNTSVVFGDQLILKAYRRLEPGINPDLEITRFLTEQGFPNVAALAGWYEHSGRLIDATLGVLQRFVPNEGDGWQLALDALGSDPEAFLGRVRRLGEVTGALHVALASDAADPAFAPDEPSAEALALLTATVDEEIEALFLDLPAGEPLEPIAGRGEEVRDQLRLLSRTGGVGRVIRTHGDYHLGQVLWTGDDWIVLDFEGEPARPHAERRRKHSPLRDVAGMLRSFAYVASAARISLGIQVPEAWEERAREEFLAGYFEEIDQTALLPAGAEGTEKLLSVFELEKAVYELRYELNNRPDWVEIPVAGIVRLLEAPTVGLP